jgi:hypothetical protein
LLSLSLDKHFPKKTLLEEKSVTIENNLVNTALLFYLYENPKILVIPDILQTFEKFVSTIA